MKVTVSTTPNARAVSGRKGGGQRKERRLSRTTPPDWRVCVWAEPGSRPCHLVFKTTSDLANHISRDHKKKEYECKFCSYVSLSRSSISDHEKKEHPGQTAERRKTNERAKRTKPALAKDLYDQLDEQEEAIDEDMVDNDEPSIDSSHTTPNEPHLVLVCSEQIPTQALRDCQCVIEINTLNRRLELEITANQKKDSKILELDAIIEDLKGQIYKLEEESTVIKCEVKVKEAVNGQLQAEKQELVEEISRLTVEFQASTEELKKQLDSASTMYEELSRQQDIIVTVNSKLKLELEDMKTEKDQFIANQHLTYNESLQKLTSQIDSSYKSTLFYKSLNADLNETVEELTNQKSLLETKLNQSKAQLNQKSCALNMLKGRSNRLQNENDQHIQNWNTAAETLLVYDSASTELLDKLNKSKSEITKLDNFNKELTTQLEELKVKHKSALDKLDQVCQQRQLTKTSAMKDVLESLHSMVSSDMYLKISSIVLLVELIDNGEEGYSVLVNELNSKRESLLPAEYPVFPLKPNKHAPIGSFPSLSIEQRAAFEKLLYGYHEAPYTTTSGMLRPCYLDGENVARTYINQVNPEFRPIDDKFGYRGIVIAVNFFKNTLGLPLAFFKVFLRSHQVYEEGTTTIRNNSDLRKLMKARIVQVCPSRIADYRETIGTDFETDYDDVILLLAARRHGAFILSEDLFRDIYDPFGVWRLKKLETVAIKRRLGFSFKDNGSFDAFSGTKNGIDLIYKITFNPESD